MCRSLVQPGVLDRDGSMCGKEDCDLFVLRGEVVAVLLFGQIEVAEGDAPQQDGHAEERAHRRMPGRKTDGPRVPCEIVQTERRGVADECAEDAASMRRL